MLDYKMGKYYRCIYMVTKNVILKMGISSFHGL